MENKFVNYFSRITALSIQETNAIAESMIVKKFNSGAIILKQGEPANDTYFVLEGCIRQYCLVAGEERTTNIYTEDQWIIAFNETGETTPSSHFLICHEDTTVVVGDEQKAQVLFAQFPRLETISRLIVEKAFSEQKKNTDAYLIEKPEQRYLSLQKSRPDLFQRIPQYQLASFIGVSPESLSRIRNRLSKKPSATIKKP